MPLSTLRLRLLYPRQLYELTHLSHASLSPPLVPLSSLTPPRTVLPLFLSPSSYSPAPQTTSPSSSPLLLPLLPTLVPYTGSLFKKSPCLSSETIKSSSRLSMPLWYVSPSPAQLFSRQQAAVFSPRVFICHEPPRSRRNKRS
ncbi:hypothetical protein C351_05553 [Cryptococcus neoformans c8]|nr:hypothetical protein C351_05553 [Cryptococcus neoformans var. grubii c8]